MIFIGSLNTQTHRLSLEFLRIGDSVCERLDLRGAAEPILLERAAQTGAVLPRGVGDGLRSPPNEGKHGRTKEQQDCHFIEQSAPLAEEKRAG